MKKGFTLTELMIVIAIIAVLGVLVSGNFINSLKRGRDVKRKTDLRAIKNAIEQYYSLCGSYPIALGNSIQCATTVIMATVPLDNSTTAYQYDPAVTPPTLCSNNMEAEIGGSTLFCVYLEQ